MINNIKNTVEDIAAYLLNNAISHRYDICTCKICKADMLDFILSRIPPRYAALDNIAPQTLIKETKFQLHNEITAAINEAIEIVAKNPHHEISEDKKKSFELLLNKIHIERGLDFRHYRQELLKRRLALRLSANKFNSYTEYLNFLIKNPQEYDKLFEVLCINVSEFFRDPEIWITARYLFENLIRKKKEKNERDIEIWSAGCANGEEPYSIAIILKEILKENKAALRINIYGTDIDKKCLAEALLARYAKQQLKNISNTDLNKYFIILNEQKFELKREIINRVKFQYFELSSEKFIKKVDVIFCRNVFIYFSRDMQERILKNFYNALKPQGYLIMGKVETIAADTKDIFKVIDSEAHIYQKI